jgi:hypothetical protein
MHVDVAYWAGVATTVSVVQTELVLAAAACAALIVANIGFEDVI